MKLYGENFPQSIEKLYQLGNIYTEGEMIQEALDTYQQALRLMN
jgi:cytochrome c-type biogenesis protein CcmH/NrfG